MTTPTPAETAREITSKWSMEMFGNKQPPGVMEAVFVGFGNDITAALTAAHAQGWDAAIDQCIDICRLEINAPTFSAEEKMRTLKGQATE